VPLTHIHVFEENLCFVERAFLYGPTWCANFLNMYHSFLYMFRATVCRSSGETTVFMQHLVLVTQYG